MTPSISPLSLIEPRLRGLLPADMYAEAWVDPSPTSLMGVFEHLRTLQRILYDYVPRHVAESLPRPGQMRFGWLSGTLMFTDLAGFTPLMEANAAYGREGAERLLDVLNHYFAEMIEIISKSAGILMEFTGDAMLAQFPDNPRAGDTLQAVRAGLRMQRAMEHFREIETPGGTFSIGMRVGIHTGRFLTADIGTPRRMESVLLGSAVRVTKRAEGSGVVGRVCLTEAAAAEVENRFHFDPLDSEHVLVIDDLSDEQLGEYDITMPRRRLASSLLMDRSIDGLVAEIEKSVDVVEPLASYLPIPILNLLVENAARRQIPPAFPDLVVVFVTLLGLAEFADEVSTEDEAVLVGAFSRAFAIINAAVEARGGVLKNVTYHLSGSDMLIYFGVPNGHTDDALRAAHTALSIRDAVAELTPPVLGGQVARLSCKIGMARGSVFAAEIGEPRGRREFNVLGDPVNTAARLMGRAEPNQILVTEAVQTEIAAHFECDFLGAIALKGKSAEMPVYSLDAGAGQGDQV